MSGIAGFGNPYYNFRAQEGKWLDVLGEMNREQRHRGGITESVHMEAKCGLAHTGLCVRRANLHKGGGTTRQEGGRRFAIVQDGEIYNANDLREEWAAEGVEFKTEADDELVLAGYVKYGTSFATRLNGAFACAIWDEHAQKLLLFRDRLGIKPLFYMKLGDTVVFSSEIKGILAFPGVNAKIDKEGLCEVLGLGPAKTYGKGVFRDILEVQPGHYVEYSRRGLKESRYWELVSQPHGDGWEETVEKTAYLVADAVKRQMDSDVPIATLLSGGVDSSLVTVICAEELRRQGKRLDTYSFDFEGNDVHFQANDFQPSRDRPWVEKMVDYAGTRHQYLECDTRQQFYSLFRAVDARDLPCMADVEASILYFCSKVVPHNRVVLTGECADEVFGGYPWFHKQEGLEADSFPWSTDLGPRKRVVRDDVLDVLPMDEYVKSAYERTIRETPVLHGEVGMEKRRREIAYLNLKWFMATLLDRMDRTAMHSGLVARVPFADHRIVEYLWNVPWEMKCPDGVVKGLLRKAGEADLPQDVLYRKKSPYPKTYHPEYESMLRSAVKEVMAEPNAPLRRLVDPKKLEGYLKSEFDYGKPFYGQLMAGPQMLAYLLQINYWLDRYRIQIIL